MELAKQTVRTLKRAPPGSRFQKLHRKRQQAAGGGLKNALFIIGGLVTIAAGVVTYPIPVIPSDFVILAGLVILAQGSHIGARILDAIEMWLRRRFDWLFDVWPKLPRSVQVALSTLWVLVATGVGWGVYALLNNG